MNAVPLQIPDSAYIEFPLDPHLSDIVKTDRWGRMTHDQKRAFGIFQVAKAKARGDIEVGCCVFCKTIDRIQAHHPDYNRPNRIVWLCRKHHRRVHISDPEFLARVNAARADRNKIQTRISFRLGDITINARLGEELTAALLAYCCDQELSITHVCKLALEKFIPQKYFEQAQRLLNGAGKSRKGVA